MSDLTVPSLAAAGVATCTVLASGVYCYLRSQENDIPIKNNSLTLEKHEDGSYTSIKKKRLEEKLTQDSLYTLADLFHHGLKLSESRPCLGHIVEKGGGLSISWMNYRELLDYANIIGSGLRHMGFKKGAMLGFYMGNCIEYMALELCCNLSSFIVVTLYETLGLSAVSYAVDLVEASIIFCDDDTKLKNMIETQSDHKCVKTIVMLGAIKDEYKEKAATQGIKLIQFSEIVTLGKQYPSEPEKPLSNDTALLCFTSGTTGNPKGVVISHKNIVNVVTSCLVTFEDILLEQRSKYLTFVSYLPMAHIFERLSLNLCYLFGARICVTRGNIRMLTEDLKLIRPNVMPLVPRILSRVYDKINESVSKNKFQSFLFNLALNRKMALLNRGILTKDSIWDKLVFRRIQETMGGQVEIFIIGSAPVETKILNFGRCAFGCDIVEGYGQTETTGCCTVSNLGDFRPGVGFPLPSVSLKLIDVPELSYYSSENKGEVCVKGDGIMCGYYKDEEKTRECFDEDGWLHTGDIGYINPSGLLEIFDRKKHIFKLSQGEYVAPEKVEAALSRCKSFQQCFVDGDSLKNCVVAIVVPDPGSFIPWCNRLGINGSFSELCTNKDVKKAILDEIKSIAKQANLNSLEIPKNIYIHQEFFSVENGLLTPTLKTKRPSLRQLFAENIKELYSELEN